MGSNDRGVVDDVVGGVGGGPGVHSNLGDVMNLMVNLVSDQAGLGNEVGLHSLVDSGSGDSSDSRDVVDNGGNNWGHSGDGSSVSHSDRGSVGNSSHGSSVGNSSHGSSVSNSSNGSSVGDSYRGGVSHSGDRSSVGNSGDRGSGNSSNTVASVTQTMSKETVSSQAKDRGIGLSGRSSHGGAQDGGKDNKGVHLAVM